MKKIEEYFLPLSDAEKVQKRTKRWLDEFDEEKSSYLKIKNELFLENKTILIRKHRRFAAYPLHSHQFMEFNYMLQGESRQIVNGKELLLQEKQLLLLDQNSQHELLPLREEDLLINFLFKLSDINLSAFTKIDAKNTGVTYDFLINSVLDSDIHENYLLLDLTNNEEIQATLEQMIREFFFDNRLSNDIVNSFSQVLFLQLSRVYQAQLPTIYQSNSINATMLKILQCIEENPRSLSLKSLAEELGYNRNYLSNLIKKETGKNFKQLIIEQRLHVAHRLLLTTNVSIDAISEYVGFSNKTQFYQKFKAFFNETPQKVRQMK